MSGSMPPNLKVREQGRIVSVAVIIAVGVNGDGRREVLGLVERLASPIEAALLLLNDILQSAPARRTSTALQSRAMPRGFLRIDFNDWRGGDARIASAVEFRLGD
jgi:hypothetical protein